MKFKEGQVYECIYCEVKSVFTVGERYEVKDTGTALVIYSNGGVPYYERELSEATLVKFKLVEKESEEMIKKWDIVEVITKDNYLGIDYEIGTRWAVIMSGGDTGIITVADSRQINKEGLLLKSHIKKVDSIDLEEAKVEPLFINVENLMKNTITKNWSQNEILAYLEGYMKGSKYVKQN